MKKLTKEQRFELFKQIVMAIHDRTDATLANSVIQPFGGGSKVAPVKIVSTGIVYSHMNQELIRDVEKILREA